MSSGRKAPNGRFLAAIFSRCGSAALALGLLAGGAATSAAQVQDVVWRNAVGVSVVGNGLTKTAATAFGNAGAVSTQTLEFGGYVEFSTSATTSRQMIGLGTGDASQNYSDIEYAIDLSSGTLGIYEAGTYRGAFGSYTTSDRFRVEVALGKARYFKNGAVLYTSNTAPKYPLLVDTSLYTNGGQLTNVRMGKMAWRNDLGVAASADTLTKTGAAGWNAGAISAEGILSGDGYVEFTATETNKARICGLSNGDSGQAASDVDFGLQLNADASIGVFEAGTSRGAFGTYASGDRLRVEVRGGVVRYLRNGSVFYTSGVAPLYPLLADTSLNEAGATVTDVVLAGLIWMDAAGVSVSGATLTKTGLAGWNSGAASTETIDAGSGFVEFSARETNTNRMCGLGNTDSTQDSADIDFAISLSGSGIVQVYESGTVRGSFGSYVSGDRFRVEAYPGAVRYRKNGVVFYTSTLNPAYPLAVDTSLYDTGSTIANVRFGRPVWMSDVAVLPWGAGLLNTGTIFGSAGAISTVALTSGDGAFEFTAQDTVTRQMAGLGNGNASQDHPDIEFALDMSNGIAQVYESGTFRGAFGSYVVGDRFRVELVGGVVRYKKNGATLYTSAVAPQYPLLIDTAPHTITSLLADFVTPGFTELTKVPAPTLSPSPGTYSPPQNITIANALPTATIRYTTDGSDPTSTSTPYTAPVALGAATTNLKAKGFRATLADSDTTAGTYLLQVAAPAFNPGGLTYPYTVNVIMTSATSGAEIRYTTDGSDPTPSSTLYSAAVNVAMPLTLKAKAFKLGYGSTTTTSVYNFKVGYLTFSPPGSTSYNTSQNVTISSTTTSGVTIRYTTDGTNPTASSTQYTGPVNIAVTTVLKAKGFRSGWVDSDITTAPFTLVVANPTFSPVAGSYPSGQTVTLSSLTPGATIQYTTNGLNPGAGDPAGTSVSVGSSLTVKAVGSKAGWTSSGVSVGTYLVNLGTLPSPTLNPIPGTYPGSQAVTLSSTVGGAIIRYTTDGRDPDFTSPVYQAPVVLGTTMTLKARVFKTDWAQSATAGGEYLIDATAVAQPNLNPGGGTWGGAVRVTVTTSTAGATIYYTTTGADPTTSDTTIVSGQTILVNRSMRVKARAFKTGINPSAIRVADYTLIGSVDAGSGYSLALKSDGILWSWGYNGNGQIGDGTLTSRYTPIQVPGLSDVRAISAGTFHALALKSDGSVVSWGWNNSGTLGNNSTTDSTTPVQVQVVGGGPLTGVIAVSAGYDHSMALKANGSVWCWGRGTEGQNGDGTQTNRLQAIQVPGLTGITAISAGGSHSLALKTDGLSSGTLWLWGKNSVSQLGDGGTTDRLSPFAGPTGVKAINGGRSHTLFLKTDGTISGMGLNDSGQLGDGTQVSPRTVPQPALVGLTNVTAVSGGQLDSVALRSDGTVWGTGRNYMGELGDSSTLVRTAPVQARWVTGVVSAATGDVTAYGTYNQHSIALASDGRVWTWGDNSHGQLGNGTTTTGHSPKPISGFSVIDRTWPGGDADNDGLSNEEEIALGTNPLNRDTNGDGVLDGAAVGSGLSATNLDMDADGVTNVLEVTRGTDPFRTDTDGDGSNDNADCFPLDPTRWLCPTSTPGDVTPPVITLTEPTNASLLSSVP